MDKTLSSLAVTLVGLLGLALAVGCEEDEAPPPLPAATAAPAPTEAVILMPEEEAPIDAGEEKPKKYVGGKAAPKASLKACCAALQQNAQNAPEPTKTYMTSAAATCNALVIQGFLSLPLHGF